jgi:glycosyltransferase involved in cell wall biosynthesis
MHHPQTPTLSVTFVTWIEHRRTRQLCTSLGMELLELTTARRGLRRYAELTSKTIAALRRRRPEVLVVQSPSMVLSLLCAVLRPWLQYRLIIDAHNEAVTPEINPWLPFRVLTRLLIKSADLVIVTNRALAQKVSTLGTRSFVLPDRIPEAPEVAAAMPPTNGRLHVAVIATYAKDEPIAAIIAAAATLGDQYELSLTGNPTKLEPAIRAAATANVQFTGFLSESDYWRLLRSSDLVMDLTVLDNCLVCGAYEALAVSKPLVLSRNDASVDLFGDAACYTDNSAGSIALALRSARADLSGLRVRASAARQRLNAEWDERAVQLRTALGQLCRSTSRESVST